MKCQNILLTAAALFWAGLAQAETMKMAVTTSFSNSGLAEILLPEIEKDTGITVELLVVGTGQALELGANGDVDAVLVHSKAAEEKWLAEGHGTHRREIMWNDFIIVGPAADPAATKAAAKATEAFAAIATAQATFVSRGDDSGTHKAELKLWKDAGVEPAGDWYKSVGQGMGAALNTAAGLDAYILSDRASWLSFENKAGLDLLFEGDPALHNQYSYLPVNPEAHPTANAAASAAVETWLTSDKAKGLIEGYRIADQQLFHFNATAE